MANPVHGTGNGGIGVHGTSDSSIGVHGRCFGDSTGVFGQSRGGIGVHGKSDTNNTGVFGQSGAGEGVDNPSGFGVHGDSPNNIGVVGRSRTSTGVEGFSRDVTGVVGQSAGGFGVVGQSDRRIGVLGVSNGTGPEAIGVVGRGGEGRLAGRFEGVVEVTDDVRLTGGDCAEEFDVVETEIVEPGTVMVLGEEGELQPSYTAYDKRVAGVVSGAGDYKPGIVLDKQTSQRKRQPIALLGKAYCKVDAEYAPIKIGDLLTTSPTRGHAMKASDSLKAFGTVIGKALRPVREAQNLIPILITLQ